MHSMMVLNVSLLTAAFGIAARRSWLSPTGIDARRHLKEMTCMESVSVKGAASPCKHHGMGRLSGRSKSNDLQSCCVI